LLQARLASVGQFGSILMYLGPARQTVFLMNTDAGNNYVELLRGRAGKCSDKTAVTFLVDGEEAAWTLTYAELDLRARAVAVRLSAEILPGDRVLLLQPPGLEFVISFFGCFYAGAVAVAAYPPRNARHMPRIEAILEDAQARMILTSEEARAKIEPWLGERMARFRLICSEEIDTAGAGAWQMPPLRPDTLALLQYTSGSTGEPRGVMVTHGNIMANEEMIRKTFGHHSESSFASWLPIYHDMGLIGNLLQPLYLGTTTVLMSPTSFLQKPVRWLSAISRFRVRVTGAPNFAFDLCARAITEEQKAALDLSCLEIAYNGSEPVDARALDRFATAFRDCGLRREALYPCYGMAEVTLLCTGGRPGAGPRYLEVDAEALASGRYGPANGSTRKRLTLVSCGESVPGQDLHIVGPSSRTVLRDGAVGEVWLRGPHVSAGYWRKDSDTRELCNARLADGDGPFLRSGDLGFVHGGELYVTGRIKDVIVIRGRNHYPQDIERTVEVCHDALQLGSCAAFAVALEGVEQLVVAVELRRAALKSLDCAAVVGAIRSAVMEIHELAVHAVALLKPLTLPKTSSGKLQRHRAKSGFLEATLDSVFIWREAVSVTNAATVPVLDTRFSQSRADAIIDWLREYNETRVNSFLMDERRSIPPYIVLDFGNHGVLGLQAPVEIGGADLSCRDTLRVLIQLAAIDTNLCSFVGAHNALGLRPVLRYGTATMRAEVLPRLASGRELASFAFTEPGAGSNPRAITATARPDGAGGWYLNGTKKWIGTAAWAGYLVVFAHLLDDEGVDRGITAFLLPQSTPGMRQGAEELTMGMRGMVQNTVYLEAVPVRAENVLGQIGEGMVVAQDIMKFGRLCICAACIGTMKRCVQLMLRYAGNRSISTGPLLDNLISRERLTNLTDRIAALDHLVFTFANWIDQGLDVPEEFYALAKIAGPESLAVAADHLLQMLGGRGYIETNIAPQLYRDARLLRIFEGPTETMLIFLGSRLASESRPLDEFLRTRLGAPALATQLVQAANSVKARHLSAGDGAVQALGVQRVCQLLGDLGVWTLWLAILERALVSTGGQMFVRAVDWLRREQAHSLSRLNAPTTDYPDPLTPAELSAITTGYSRDIGDVEQHPAGVEYALDPFLRRPGPALVSVSERQPAALQVTTIFESPVGTSVKPNGNERVVTSGDVEAWLRTWIGRRLGVPAGQIDPLKPFADFAIDSASAVELSTALGEWLGAPLPATTAWDFPNIRVLAEGVTGTPTASPVQAQPTAAVAPPALESLSVAELATLLSAELETLP
jgi:acyl-CoA synthetase (AMP-forming)/AMP-acid ligase II/alkylation response protein AidB-like acyl-CoA dehydrogenase/acyl carrier protein